VSDYAGIYVAFVVPLVTLYHVAVIGVATGAVSLFVTKSDLLNSFHAWLEKRSPFLENMLSCPWCTSHWVGAFLLLAYQPLLDAGWRPAWTYASWLNFFLTPVDWLVTLTVVVAVAAVTARVILSAYKGQ
jgi:ABC-type antimicrobial peptide transport system permease subunit